jgi:hypothetical protein
LWLVAWKKANQINWQVHFGNVCSKNTISWPSTPLPAKKKSQSKNWFNLKSISDLTHIAFWEIVSYFMFLVQKKTRTLITFSISISKVILGFTRAFPPQKRVAHLPAYKIPCLIWFIFFLFGFLVHLPLLLLFIDSKRIKMGWMDIVADGFRISFCY